MRVIPFLVMVGLVAGCSPKVPDSAAGVGFGDYNAYVRGATPTTPPPAVMPSAPAGFSAQGAAAAIDRATGAAPAGAPGAPLNAMVPNATTLAAEPIAPQPLPASGDRPRGNAPVGIQEETGELLHINPTISDEQDFQAVSARETIESDKQRIERNRAQYQIDQPTALPQRTGDNEASAVIQFALSTSHPVGTQMYKRSSLRLKNPEAACLEYSSGELAQEAFLAAGGPERDRKGLDADGDGYACDWDPSPFRAALQ
jgi:hypothetical protein